MLSSSVHFDPEWVAWRNSHPAREHRSFAKKIETLSLSGFSGTDIAVVDVVMYPSHATCNMTATPISAPNRTASGLLRKWDPFLELCTPQPTSAEAAVANGALRPAVARPPKDPALARSTRTTSSVLMSRSAAACFTFSWPPAIFIPTPSGRPVLLENTPKAAARALLAAIARRHASCAAATRAGLRDHSCVKSSKVVATLPARMNAAKNEASVCWSNSKDTPKNLSARSSASMCAMWLYVSPLRTKSRATSRAKPPMVCVTGNGMLTVGCCRRSHWWRTDTITAMSPKAVSANKARPLGEKDLKTSALQRCPPSSACPRPDKVIQHTNCAREIAWTPIMQSS